MSLDEDAQDLQNCGYYFSETEINKVQFVSDSVLAVLVNGFEVKVLSTDRFLAGDVRDIS